MIIDYLVCPGLILPNRCNFSMGNNQRHFHFRSSLWNIPPVSSTLPEFSQQKPLKIHLSSDHKPEPGDLPYFNIFKGLCYPVIWMFPKVVVPPNHPSLIGFSIIKHPFWGTPNFWKHPYSDYYISPKIKSPVETGGLWYLRFGTHGKDGLSWTQGVGCVTSPARGSKMTRSWGENGKRPFLSSELTICNVIFMFDY